MERRNTKMLAALAPALIAGLAALAATSMVGTAAVRLPLQVVAVAAIVALAWRGARITEREEAREEAVAAAPAVVQRIAGDRRRPTFDRETGLLADWYFRLRVEEEIARAQRYGQKFTMLRLTQADEDERRIIATAARTCLRAIDLAGTVGAMTCILLPNTTRDAAVTVADRLQELAPSAAIESTECPTDGSTLAALLAEDLWAVSAPVADEEAEAA